MNIFERFVNEELEATNGPRLIEITIAEKRPHFHSRAWIDGRLICPGCYKVYYDSFLHLAPPIQLSPLSPEEILTGSQAVAIFSLSFVSTMSLLMILYAIGEMLL